MKKSIKAAPASNSIVWLVPILVLGGILRIYNNATVSLWHDEAFSALYLRYSWSEMMQRIILDVHPPLYYWLLRLWSYLFGDSVLALRSMSIVFGILTIYAGYLLVRELFKNEKLAILSALFIAINPFQIFYALEARMYTLGTFLVLFSSYLLLKALATNKTWFWLAYAATVAAGFYTHYYLLFSVAAQGLYFLYHMWSEKRWELKGIFSYALAAVLYLPWLPSLLEQFSRVSGGFWIPEPDRWAIPATIWKMVFGGFGTDHISLSVVTILALVLFYFFTKETNGGEWAKTRWFVILGFALPVLAAIAISLKQAIYQDRYFVFASLFFSILIAMTIFLFPKYTTRRTLAAVFVAVSVILFFKNWKDMGPVDRKPGMRAASEFINDSARPSDRIYVGSTSVMFTFKYYNETGIDPKYISEGPYETIPHFAGTAILDPEDVILAENIFNNPETVKNDTVWLIWTTGFYQSKPNVPGNWQKINERTYGDMPWYKGDIIVTQYHVD